MDHCDIEDPSSFEALQYSVNSKAEGVERFS